LRGINRETRALVTDEIERGNAVFHRRRQPRRR
jgi:hypothetical protein